MVELPKLPECIDKTLTNLADDPSKAIGKTIRDLYDLVLGSRVAFAAEKKKIKYAHDLEEYRKSLERNVDAIPEDKYIEPSMQIAAQSLVDSQYCLDTEELREMFAKLIARSMHADYSNRIHPTFSKLLQQLSPLDAQILTFFSASGVHSGLPIANIVGYDESRMKKITCATNIPAYLPDRCSTKDAARSIVVLLHLGIVYIPDNTYLCGEGHYDHFTQSEEFMFYQQLHEPQGYAMEIEKRVAHLTPLGIDFVSVCLG